MKYPFLICILILCGSAAAETTVGSLEPTTGTWRVYSGSGFSTLVCSAASEDAAKACAAADAEAKKASVRYQLRYPNRYLTVTYSAPPPSPPEPTETWTRCAGEGELCGYTGTRRSRLGVDTRWRVLEVAAVNGGVMCRNSVFGGDPAPGVVKACYLSSVVLAPAPTPEPPPPTPTPATGTATLSWTPPTQNTDGTSLTNLAGYRIAYGTSATALVYSKQVAAGVNTTIVDGLAPGTWYFAARSLTTGGTESGLSNVVSKTVAP